MDWQRVVESEQGLQQSPQFADFGEAGQHLVGHGVFWGRLTGGQLDLCLLLCQLLLQFGDELFLQLDDGLLFVGLV